jgi:hypothetical protein
MKRNEIINEILSLYDENEKLKLELEKRAGFRDMIVPKINEFENIDKEMIELAKKTVLKNTFYYYDWKIVECWEDEDSEQILFTSYDKWLKEKINISHIPDFMSKNEFIKYFKKEIDELYELEKEKALKKFKENEEN